MFAGGDIVTGSATVILAMGAGRKAAAGILRYLGIEHDVPAAEAEAAGAIAAAAEDDPDSEPATASMT